MNTPMETTLLKEGTNTGINYCKNKGVQNIRVSPQAIVDGNESAIMGLLWLIMFTYNRNNDDYDMKVLESESPRNSGVTSDQSKKI